MSSTLNRRSFITRGAAAAGGGLASAAALERLLAGDAAAAPGRKKKRRGGSYGPLERKADQRGVEVLALPAGFSYVTFSHSGSTMSDGNPTPLALDGMSAFQDRRAGRVRLVRNSEDRNPPARPACSAIRRPSTTLRAVAAPPRSCTTSVAGADGRLGEPQRHDRQLAGGRGLGRAAGSPPRSRSAARTLAPPCASRSATATSSRCRCRAVRAS